MAARALTMTTRGKLVTFINASPILNTDTTDAFDTSGFTEVSFSLLGTPGAGFSIRPEVSVDGITWFTATSQTATGSFVVHGNNVPLRANFMRFNCTGGDGTTSITVMAVGN